MGKVCFLLLVLFLTACAPVPTPVTTSPVPISTAATILVEEPSGNLTLVEFFAVN